MRRGTTPTHEFATDTDISQAKEIFITYKQNSYTVIEKTKEDFDEITDKHILLRLSQKDTLGFKPQTKITIQIRAVFNDGSAMASNIIETSVDDVLKEVKI